ncbi:hypothetical protein KY358_05470 [Candidatus Woesearchaeota archaeon]|nr:hypothetical protein [Candidatus Woesearchaeota archaeon]
MISLSKNEFNVIGFLIRNFSKRFTIRNVASKIGITAAGAHAALKKLEGNRIVRAEKLGTGLFYEVNLDDKAAFHLAAFSLLRHFEIKDMDMDELKEAGRAAAFDGKNILVVANDKEKAKDICYTSFKGIKAICRKEEELIGDLRDDESEASAILRKGNVLFGEELVLSVIKRAVR